MIRSVAPFCFLPVAALAETPQVMTDFAPIHSLTAQVMGDLGTPDVLLPPGADPHDFALRPSDAARLGDADLVIWAGEGMTPWLEETLGTLAPNAKTLELLETEGWETLPIRDGHGDHDDHDDHDEAKAEDDHGHDDHGHDDHGHDEAKAEDDHDHDAHDHDDHAGHDHGDFDPHAWTDPQIAQVWLTTIADALSAADPENAVVYAQNAATAADALAALDAELAQTLAPVAGATYVLPHDGYQYFEARYGLNAEGSIAGIDARDPGPAQIAALRAEMAEDAITCVFSDAEIGDSWAQLVIEGTQAQTAQIDAVGAGLEAGPGLYAAMMRRLGAQFAACLG